jgi:hypothetical protein
MWWRLRGYRWSRPPASLCAFGCIFKRLWGFYAHDLTKAAFSAQFFLLYPEKTSLRNHVLPKWPFPSFMPPKACINQFEIATQMKHLMIVAALWLTLPLLAQSPFGPQLAVPVYFNDANKPNQKEAPAEANAFLSGIALLFLDTANTADELLVTDNSDLVVWHELVGKSTKATFVVPDSQFVGRLELMYFGTKCQVELWWQDRSSADKAYAKGELVLNEKGEYALHFFADENKSQKLGSIFKSLNTFLMQLHARNHRKVAMKSWFSKDSVNVIVGADSQFDTDFDLFWLDKSLRKHLQKMAANAYSKLFKYDKEMVQQQDSVVNTNKRIYHHAVRQGTDGMQGIITIEMKPDKRTRYVFLKPFHRYEIRVEYEFEFIKNRPGQLTIRKFGLRNINNGDFVEMDIFDFMNNGLPVMYVDLIRGVVTAPDAWDMTNVVHIVEDVLKASKLPFD